MSIHKSLRSGNRLRRHRSVLTRAERVAKLTVEGKFSEDDSVFGLPKVRVASSVKKKAAKKKKKEDEE